MNIAEAKASTTGYLMFSNKMRETESKLLVSELAKRWEKLDDGEKNTWNDKAEVQMNLSQYPPFDVAIFLE